jgi:hypothetical protein
MKKISIYENKWDSTSKFTITIDKALERIKNGKHKDVILHLRAIESKAQYDVEKGLLTGVCFSGTFEKRTDDALIEHSGMACIDFDNHPDAKRLKDELSKDEYIYACWLSPRGNGVKALVKIPASKENHRKHYEALFERYPESDKTCKNESRLCFESYDPDLYLNKESKEWTKFTTKKVVEMKRRVETDDENVFEKLITWQYRRSSYFSSGNRNTFIYTLASALCRCGISKSSTESMIVYKYSIDSDFSQNEMMSAINSAYRTNSAQFGSRAFDNEETYYQTIDIKGDIKAYEEEQFDLTDVIFGDSEGVLDVYKNGYGSAETTFFPQIDPIFKWKKGDITLMSGIGNHGKSSFTLQLMLIKSINNGDKWALFVPENMPSKLFYAELTEMLIGCSIEPENPHRPHLSQIEQIQEWLAEHFIVVHPVQSKPTPEYIKSKFLGLIMKYGVTGILFDPFNKLLRDYKSAGDRDDRFLEAFLTDLSVFTKHHNIFCVIIAHPTKLHKGLDDKDYPCPNVFNVAGGASWNNAMDNIVFFHRPFKISEPMNPICQFTSSKIRWKKIVGQEGTIDLMYNFKKRRFYINNTNPLEGNPFNYNTDIVKFDEAPTLMSIKSETTNPYDMSEADHVEILANTFGLENSMNKKDFMVNMKQTMLQYKYPVSKATVFKDYYIKKGKIEEQDGDYILNIHD